MLYVYVRCYILYNMGPQSAVDRQLLHIYIYIYILPSPVQSSLTSGTIIQNSKVPFQRLLMPPGRLLECTWSFQVVSWRLLDSTWTSKVASERKLDSIWPFKLVSKRNLDSIWPSKLAARTL